MWKTGSCVIANPVVLAPMAGVSDKAFRMIAKEHGCGLVYTEMISAKALSYKNIKTRALLDLQGEKQPIAVQLFGSEPDVMAEAAVIAERAGAQIIDVNMGCPVPKVVKNGEGSALMGKPDLAYEIIRTLVQSVKVPVAAKIRSGWDDRHISAVSFAGGLEKAGAKAVAVHARTREQYYAGKADWQVIRAVKEHVAIPVLGSGDIWTPEDAERMMETTGCDAVMLGRGVLGNPWLISRTVAFLEGKGMLPPPSAQDKIIGALKHLELAVHLKGEKQAVLEMRKHLAWYLKGLPHTAQLKANLFRVKTEKEAVILLKDYLHGC